MPDQTILIGVAVIGAIVWVVLTYGPSLFNSSTPSVDAPASIDDDAKRIKQVLTLAKWCHDNGREDMCKYLRTNIDSFLKGLDHDHTP